MPVTQAKHTELVNVGKHMDINKNIYIPEEYGGTIIDLIHLVRETPILEYLTTKKESFPYQTGPPENTLTSWQKFPWNQLHDIQPDLTRILKKINTTAEQITGRSYKKGGYCKYSTPGVPKWLSYQGELHIYLPMMAITGHEKTIRDIIYARVVYVGIIGGV